MTLPDTRETPGRPRAASWGQGIIPILLLLLGTPRELHGYIDPISGSILLQVIGAGILAAVLTVKRVWRKLAAGLRWMRERITRAPPAPPE